ncbi:MAG: Ig-like domain-containing protein [Prolixibacteraceae bacterium]|nr:Ig-like domain-containing protein [Prolixibacteraceae bacterium]
MIKKFKLTNEMGTPAIRKKRYSWFFNSTWIMLLLLSTMMWQCEKDDFEEIVGNCPVVDSTDPDNLATGVPLDQKITATFNVIMNPATLTRESFILQNGTTKIPGIISYTEKTVSFMPATLLVPNTTYTAIVKPTVKDAMGNSLQTDYIWEFTTNLSPGVILTDPLNNATNVEVNQVIAATFSVPMKTESINMTTFLLKNGEIPIAGVITYNDSTAYFKPTRTLAPSAIYTAIITSGAMSESGTSLESDYVWSFNTSGIPAVTFTDPENLEEEVALDKTVTATFSEPMDPATLNITTFTLKQGANKITGTVSTDGTTVSFDPVNNFLYGTTYIAMITTGAKNTDGKTLVANYIWTFTTNSMVPPTVISTDPTNNEGNVDLDKNISATFSVPMDPSTLNTSTFSLKQGSETIAGTVTYSGNTVVFNPDDNLLYSKEYTATITTGAKNTYDIAMKENHEWKFNTKNAVSPTVISTDPANLETDVELDKTITATFSVPMDQGSFTPSTFIVRQGANTVNGVISYNGTTVSFVPDNDLSFGKTYIATITTGVRNTEGTTLANNYVWAFTAEEAPAPTVILTDPARNENNVVLDQVVTVTFSEPMNESTLNNSTFTLKQGSTTVNGTVECSGAVATFTPYNNLLSGENYTATLTTGVINANGTNLANNYSWGFNTVEPLGPPAADLKTVARFGIFAGERITNNTGATEIRNMDVGINPGLRADITGFPPASVINGSIYASDDGSSVENMLIQAKIDLTDAYHYCEGLTSPAPVTLEFDIGGQTLAPGLYKSESTMLIQMGNVILDAQGDVNAVWIFQIAAGLNTLSGSGGNIILANGAQAKNVFWQVGNSAVIGEGTTFNGTIIALNSITMNIGATLNGRILARHNSVYINTVIINKP